MPKTIFDTPAYQKMHKAYIKDGVCVITFENDAVELPWDVIRYWTDHEFKSYMDQADNEINKIQGKRIKQFLFDKGISQKQLAKKLGISTPVVSRMVNGQERIPFSLLKKILTILNLELKDFVV